MMRSFVLLAGLLFWQTVGAVQIALPVNPTPQEKFAARELAGHLNGIFKKTVPVVSEKEVDSREEVFFIGATEHARKQLTDRKLAAPGEEQSWMIKDGRNYCIVGGGKRGTIYGVYDYLEDLGVVWASADVTMLPSLSKITFPEGATLRKLPTNVRYLAWNLPTDELWRVRNRLNGMNAMLPEEFGGFYPEASGGECHFLRILAPYELCEKEHPDWFATGKDGKLSKGDPQWGPNHCTTNPGFRAHVVEQARKHLDKTGAKEIWIGQADGLSAGCFCPRCTAERKAFLPAGTKFRNDDRKAGSELDPTAIQADNIPWSINTIAFANAVAAEIAKSHPDVKLLTLAYAYSVDAPPSGPKPADNVIVYLTGPSGGGNCCAFHGYRQGKYKILNDWVKLGARMRLYTYGASNYGFWYPFPNIIAHAEDIQKLYRDGVEGFFDQGALGGKGSGLVELRAWLGAKMMRSPETSAKDAVRTFCRAYYGPAADAVADYVIGFDDEVRNRKIHGDVGWGNPQVWRKWCDEKTLARGKQYQQQALNAVANDPELTARVERAFMEIDWLEMMLGLLDQVQVKQDALRFLVPGKEERTRNAAKRFLDLMTKNGYDRLSEPAWFYGEDSIIAVLLRDHKVYRLGKGIGISPALGGSIVEWPGAGRGNMFKLPRTLMPFNEHYETVFSPEEVIPWLRANFAVNEYVPGKKLVLSAERKEWRVRKSFLWENGVLTEQIDVTNLSARPRTLAGFWRPVLSSDFWQNGKVSFAGTEKSLSGNIDEQLGSGVNQMKMTSADRKTQLNWTFPVENRKRLYFGTRKLPNFNFDFVTVELRPECEFAPQESKSWRITGELKTL